MTLYGRTSFRPKTRHDYSLHTENRALDGLKVPNSSGRKNLCQSRDVLAPQRSLPLCSMTARKREKKNK